MDISSFFSNVLPPATRVAGSQDILIEILTRVPAKSLFRFKCVSRNWRCLISDDGRFALIHTKRNLKLSCSGLISFSSQSPEKTRFDFFWISNRLKFTPRPPVISFLQSVSCTRIFQSCNGLLLCSSSRADCAYFVCNPVLGRLCSIDLPDGVGIGRNWDVLGLTLAFDASRWSEFKVICTSSSAIDVYSSGGGEWKRLIQWPFHQLNLAFEGVYWNGRVIWLSKELQGSGFSKYLVLDLDRETIEQRELPCTYSMVCYFGESMGHLHLATMDDEHFNLYGMGENVDWELKFRVVHTVMRAHLSGGYEIHSSVWGGSWVLSVVKKQEEDGYLVMWFLSSGKGRVLSYNSKTSLTSCLAESKVPGKIFHFLESLYWV